MNKLVKFTLLSFGLIILGVGIYFSINIFRAATAEVVYHNDSAGFSLFTPPKTVVLEFPKEDLSGAVGKDIYFTKSTADQNNPSGLLVSYRTPVIYDKNETCLDSAGNITVTQYDIAGQTVNVCLINGFKAFYFKHPTRPIEYWVGTVGITDQKEIIKWADLVIEGLQIE